MNDETEIIVNKLMFENNEPVEGEELIRTKEKLLLVMDSSTDFQYVQVRVKNGNNSSCWIPSLSESDDISLVPEEFKILNINK